MPMLNAIRDVIKATPGASHLAGKLRTACFRYGLETRRRDLLGQMSDAHGNYVHAGPFSGMTLLTETAETSWTDGNRLPRLLGTYECHLYPAIEAASRVNQYDCVVNIGCAEGYYAVGLARLMPSATVHAFDILPNARRLCEAASRQNGVSDRVIVRGECTLAELNAIAAAAKHTFVVIDCEGAEADLLRLDQAPSLASADILVECHDFLKPGITADLTARFAATHDIWLLRPREKSSYLLDTFSEVDQMLATCEFRATSMNWLFCAAKSHESRSAITSFLRQAGAILQ